jgi:hypothetical protein
VHGIGEVRRLDHVVLLVAAESVLGPEGGNQLDILGRGKRVKRVNEIARHRRRMREQRRSLARQSLSQCSIFEQTVNTELHPVPERTRRDGESLVWPTDV